MKLRLRPRNLYIPLGVSFSSSAFSKKKVIFEKKIPKNGAVSEQGVNASHVE